MKYILRDNSIEEKSFSPYSILVLSALLVAILGIMDAYAHMQLAFTVFYLIPLFFTVWYINAIAGVFVLALCIVSWVIGDVVMSRSYIDTLIPYWNIVVNGVFFLIIIRILSEFKESLDREKVQARTDFLTQLANRRFFCEMAQNEVNRAFRYHHPLTLVYLDVDNFKKVNDDNGHKTGDRLLCDVAEAIKRSVRNTDVVGRLGGDEFAVLYPETSFDEAFIAVERIKKAFEDIMQERKMSVTLSIGAVTVSDVDHLLTLDVLLKHADTLMYEAKASGKNMVKQLNMEQTVSLEAVEE
ncbi:MAG: GGDEF domain-containing protein [Candidatus Ancaeobacter aquaticus]|nr:GGDEF domain-containing protein [Candidatus Ancaeobacter aquaticus]